MSITTFWRHAICFSFCIAASSVVIAQEPEDRGTQYEDDAWYDITEWFDGNDYNPTDETFGRWDDEIYDSNDAVNSSDYDSDWSYYDDTDYGYYDDYGYQTYDYDSYASNRDYNYDYNYGYGDYDYDYSPYRDHLSNYDHTAYGYYADPGWYYDYWDGEYHYYSDLGPNGVYGYSYRYYDFDQDGLYDAYFYYGDTDRDGVYDYANYQSLNRLGDANQSQAQAESKKDAQRHQVSGKIEQSKKVKVGDGQHWIVMLDSSDTKNPNAIVDLGNVDSLKDIKLDQGAELSAKGALTKTGEKEILLADSFTVGGTETKVDRSRQAIEGSIVKTKKMKLNGQEHLFAVVKTKDSKNALVDLGQSDSLSVNLSEGDPIQVYGFRVRANHQPVVVAFKFQHKGQDYDISRQQPKPAASDATYTRNTDSKKAESRKGLRLRGEIVDMKTAQVGQQSRQMATIKTKKENKVVVDLGRVESLKPELKQGDTITVRGLIAKANDKTIFVAQQLTKDGTNYTVSRPIKDDRVTSPQQRKLSGKISKVNTQTVRDQTRQMVTIRTRSGDSVLIDLGPNQKLGGLPLKEGAEISVEGYPVKVDGQRLIVATQVTSGEQSKEIERSLMKSDSSE